MSRSVLALGLAAAITITAPAHAERHAPSFVTFGDSADAPAGFLDLCLREPGSCGLVGDPASPAELRETVACLNSGGTETIAPAHQGEATVAGPCPPLTSMTAAEATLSVGGTGAIRTILPPDRSNGSTARGGWQLKTVRAINEHVNARVRQRTDRERFGVDEYWQASGTGKGAAGDCEDIALQKQQELLAAGFPADRMFLAVVFSSRIGLHTVLVVRLEDGDVVLDSATGGIRSWDRTGYSWLRVQSPTRKLEWRRVRPLERSA
ncbi:transglutaminase-like cysteine peptidase [Allosphingosinicella deserti]|uniref:Transglutaminase n=1 Tax=Allosphingosinicella deserti TaxID=2116704 RepID=A0A2P7QJZ1_9SPHN|nr:transglutaminase-like cysteine peptidase [Sphingomonas deserti]PSJ38287.1 hypothetical protein C7I55_17670 [Sphingomonas deserti]